MTTKLLQQLGLKPKYPPKIVQKQLAKYLKQYNYDIELQFYVDNNWKVYNIPVSFAVEETYVVVTGIDLPTEELPNEIEKLGLRLEGSPIRGDIVIVPFNGFDDKKQEITRNKGKVKILFKGEMGEYGTLEIAITNWIISSIQLRVLITNLVGT